MNNAGFRRDRALTAPITFFFLVLPDGISSGFVSITLPFASLSGWVHDRFSTAWRLHLEAFIGIGCVVVALAILRQINTPRAPD